METNIHTPIHTCRLSWIGQSEYILQSTLAGGEVGSWGCFMTSAQQSDTIYHRPLNMETFITSWQENLVENNHSSFDNNLAPSCGLHLDPGQLCVSFNHYSKIHFLSSFFFSTVLIKPTFVMLDLKSPPKNQYDWLGQDKTSKCSLFN